MSSQHRKSVRLPMPTRWRAGPRRTPLAFSSLPPEIWTRVALCLDRQSVINLASSSRFAYYLCQPALYHTLTVLHPGDPNYKEYEVLKRGHLGHVRCLRVRADVVPDTYVNEIVKFSAFRHLRVLDLTICCRSIHTYWAEPPSVELPPHLSDHLPLLTTLSFTLGRRRRRLSSVHGRAFLASAHFPILSSFSLYIYDRKITWDLDELRALDTFLRIHGAGLRELALPCWHLTRGPSAVALKTSIAASLSRAPLRRLVTSYPTARQLVAAGTSSVSLEELTVVFSPLLDNLFSETMAIWPPAPHLKKLAFCVGNEDRVDWESLARAYPELEYLSVDWTHAGYDCDQGKYRKLPRGFPGSCPKLKWVLLYTHSWKKEKRYRVRRNVSTGTWWMSRLAAGAHFPSDE
ncbi:hypothetical protein PUNSTDRAFT_127868, partial [Punctularia strigosozonata HHB-11173 SS5]|uniref:uncharacterized protein n=1 Tax=Punctularia strigosozonata (strain HHB-11173) TaxID=741275 RepID=UPI0004417EBF